MVDLILHPSTKRQLERYIQRPSHAVILVGPEGIGKHAASRWLAMNLLDMRDGKVFDSYPYQRTISPEGPSISIDTIRELIQFTKLKTPQRDSGTHRISIIEEAQLLTPEAQNAILKVLEEPPIGTVFILTTTNRQSLLPTILSRVQTITLQQPNTELLMSHFMSLGYKERDVRRTYLMSGGLPGLMTALLEQKEDHPLTQAAAQARTLLQSDTFTRLCLVDTLAKQRTECSRLFFMLGQMAHAALVQSAESTKAAQSVKRWHKIQLAAYEAESSMHANAQIKLILTNLMLKI